MKVGRPKKLPLASAVARLEPELDRIAAEGGGLADALASDYILLTITNTARGDLRPLLANLFGRFIPASAAAAAARTLVPGPGRKSPARKASTYVKKPLMRNDFGPRRQASHYGRDGFADVGGGEQ